MAAHAWIGDAEAVKRNLDKPGPHIRAASSAAAEARFPALRIGAHSGSVLYREGDYVGAGVNLAARVAATAIGVLGLGPG